MTEVDTVLDAHIARQKAWAEEAKELFRGPTEDEKRRAKILDDLEVFNAQRRTAQAAAERARKLDEMREEIAARRDEIAAMQADIKDSEAAIKELESGLKRADTGKK